MVWGIEKSVPLPNGGSKPGREAAIELSSRYKHILDSGIGTGLVIPQEPEYRAAIRYQLMTSVPENWIPFIPTHKDGDNREIQLQRASMPRPRRSKPAGENQAANGPVATWLRGNPTTTLLCV